MFGTYRSNNNMFYIGLFVGGVVGMYAARWVFNPSSEKGNTITKTMVSEVATNIDNKISKMNDKEKERMFNNFINPNKSEKDLYDEFSESDLTN